MRFESLPAGINGGFSGPQWWIGNNDFAAVLFYSRDGDSVMTVGGKMPDGGNTKILWLVRRAAPGPLTIRGSERAGGPMFGQEVDGAGSYPSTVVVPRRGCWTLEVSVAGRNVGLITIPVRDN